MRPQHHRRRHLEEPELVRAAASPAREQRPRPAPTSYAPAGNMAFARLVQRHGQIVSDDLEAGEVQATESDVAIDVAAPADVAEPASGGGGGARGTSARGAGVGFGTPSDGAAAAPGFAAVQQGWPGWGVPARAESLGWVVGRRLMDAGVPSPRGVPKTGLGPNTLGSFGFQTWVINLNQDRLLSARTLSDAATEGLADTLFHEAEHCEQWFRMARYYAGLDHDASEVVTKMRIPNSVASAAVARKMEDGSAEANAIKPIWESVYGTGRTARRDIYTELDAANAALTALYATDPTARQPATQAAERRARAAFAAYQGLPEEVAARQTGTAGMEGLREYRAILRAIERMRRERQENTGDFPMPTGDTNTGVG